jgi:predicted nucleic acid-binding protein
MPFDIRSARAYGRVHAAVVEQGRQSRRGFADLLIAATALAEDSPLVTRNGDDFKGSRISSPSSKSESPNS